MGEQKELAFYPPRLSVRVETIEQTFPVSQTVTFGLKKVAFPLVMVGKQLRATFSVDSSEIFVGICQTKSYFLDFLYFLYMACGNFFPAVGL